MPSTPVPPRTGLFEQFVARLRAQEESLSPQLKAEREADLTRRRAALLDEATTMLSEGAAKDELSGAASLTDRYFAERLSYQARADLFVRALGWLWIRRVRCLLGLLAAVVCVALVGGLLYVGVVEPRRRAQAEELNRLVLRHNSQVKTLEGRLSLARDRLANAELLLQYGGDEPALVECSQRAAQALHKESETLEQVQKRVTPQFVIPVEGESPQLPAELSQRYHALTEAGSEVQALIERVQRLPELYQQHQKIHANLVHAYAVLLEQEPSDPFLRRAAALRDQTLESIAAFGSLEQEEAWQKALVKLGEDWHFWQGFRPLVMRLEEEIKSIAEDTEAVQQAESGSRLALGAADRQDEAGARYRLESLQALLATLRQEFTLRIVNIPAEYSRIWYNNATHTDKLYYVIVEARDSKGNLVPQDIISELDGSKRRVTRWAERVSPQTYEDVGRDKQDDGVIQNDLVATKRFGHLEPEYSMGMKTELHGKADTLRLNRWPARK